MCLTLFLPGCQEHRSEGTEMPDNDGERRGMTRSAEPIGPRTIIRANCPFQRYVSAVAAMFSTVWCWSKPFT
jgi:hypothetical protein